MEESSLPLLQMEAINLFSPAKLDVCDSYGLIAVELLYAWRKAGLHVNVLAPGAEGTVFRMAYGGVFLGYPTSYEQRAWFGQIGTRISVTMFESTGLPHGWADALNRCSGVVSPSSFFTDVLLKHGVKRPIVTTPLGVSDVYKRPQRRRREGKLRILAFGDRGKRKGVFDAMLGFASAFGDSEDVELTIKVRDMQITGQILNPNIRVVSRDMSPNELYDLYTQHQVMLFPSRGEGFGLPPREFAATGGVALVTAWSGLVDDLEQYAWPIHYELVPADWAGARNLEGQSLGMWAKPDVAHIRDLLLDVYENQEKYYEEALEKANFACQAYSWDKFAGDVLDLYVKMS